MNWKEHFSYFNGALYWNYSTGRVAAGQRAGSINGEGYRHVSLKGKFYRCSRVIWEMHNGEIPAGMEIDHEDRIRSNDKLGNLRLFTPTQNACNRGVYSNNKLGVRGVSRDGKGYRAFIRVNKKTVNLGKFYSIEEASAAYEKAKMELH